MKRLVLISIVILTMTFTGINYLKCQVSISDGVTTTQDFTIGTTATASLPLGWKADKNTTVRTVGSYSSASSATEQTAAANMSSTATNGIYNFGAGTDNTGTDRAVGGLSSSSNSKSVNIYVDLLNNGTNSISSLTISYNVEKYRTGMNSAGFTVQMYYSTDGAVWTSAGSDFATVFAGDASTSGYATTPGATVAVTSKALALPSIAAGSHIYLAWNYSVTSGTTTSFAQALGIDDVSITPSSFPPISATISGGTSPICANSDPGTYTVTASGGDGTYSYDWYMNGVSTGITTNTYEPGQLVSNTSIYCIVSSGSSVPYTTSTVNVVVNALPTANVTTAMPINLCYGNSTQFELICTGAAPWTLTVSDGTNTDYPVVASSPDYPTINDLTDVTYSIISITDNNGCSNTSSAQVIINVDPLTVAGTATATNSTLCEGNGTTISLSGSTGNIQWQSSLNGTTWTDIQGETGTVLNTGNLSVSTYYHAIVKSGVCSSAASNDVLITVNPLPTVTVTTPMPINLCYGNTQIFELVLTGAAPWTLTVFDGTSTQYANVPSSPDHPDANSLTDVTYSIVSITDNNGCSNTSTAQVIINVDPLTVAGTVSATSSSVCEGSGTSLSLTGNTGTVQWQSSPDGTAWTNINGETNPSLNTGGLSIETYYQAIVTSGVCPSATTNNASVSVDPVPTVNAGSDQSVCPGSPVTLTASGTAVSYTWNNGVTDGVAFVPSAATVYTVTGTGSNGCTKTDDVNVNLYTAPSSPIVGTITQPSCSVSTGSVMLSGLPSGNWTIQPGSVTGTGSTVTLTGLTESTTYNFTVSDGTCSSIASADVVINAQPATPSTPVTGAVTQPTCTVNTGSVDLSNLPAGNWTIYPGNINGTGLSTTVTGLLPGTYNFSVSNGSCTSTATSDIVISAFAGAPSAPVIAGVTQPNCTVSTGEVLLSGLPSGNWTLFPGSVTGSGTTTTITNLSEGTYNYSVSDGTCISSLSSDIIINAQPVTPNTPLVGTITDPTCTVATGSVELSGLPAGNWTINPGSITGTGTTTTITGLSSGTYNFTVNNGNCTSTATGDVIIDLQPVSPTATLTSSTAVNICEGEIAEIILTLTGTAPWSVVGDNGSGQATFIANSSPFTISVNPTTNTTYSIVSVSDITGCSSTSSISVDVTVNPVPTALILSYFNPSSCGQNDGHATAAGGTSYLWDAAAANQTTATATGLSAGTYFVTVTSANCSSVTSVTLSDPGSISVNISAADSSVCTGETVTFTATGAAMYEFFVNGNSQGSVSANSTFTTSALTDGDIITVNGTTGGCTGVSSSINMTIFSPAAVTLSENTGVITSSASAGNQWYDEINGIITGETGTTYTPSVNGNYFVIVTDANGCTTVSDTISFIVSASIVNSEGTVSIYPNPSDGRFTIETYSNSTYRIEIESTDSKVIYINESLNVPYRTDIDLSAYAKGLYFVKISSAEKITTKKIIFE